MKGRLKAFDKVTRKVGRIEETHKLVACQYTVTVQAGEKGKAAAVQWEPNQRYRERDRVQGTSLLRTSRVDWDDQRIVREYCRLADIEATFRSFQDELGLRPIYHSPGERVAGHLFLTVLAYHLVHALRYRLRARGISWSWKSIRNRMRTWMRLTTTMRTAQGKVWSQRQDVGPESGAGTHRRRCGAAASDATPAPCPWIKARSKRTEKARQVPATKCSAFKSTWRNSWSIESMTYKCELQKTPKMGAVSYVVTLNKAGHLAESVIRAVGSFDWWAISTDSQPAFAAAGPWHVAHRL